MSFVLMQFVTNSGDTNLEVDPHKISYMTTNENPNGVLIVMDNGDKLNFDYYQGGIKALSEEWIKARDMSNARG